jgi:hypothetical protein
MMTRMNKKVAEELVKLKVVCFAHRTQIMLIQSNKDYQIKLKIHENLRSMIRKLTTLSFTHYKKVLKLFLKFTMVQTILPCITVVLG